MLSRKHIFWTFLCCYIVGSALDIINYLLHFGFYYILIDCIWGCYKLGSGKGFFFAHICRKLRSLAKIERRQMCKKVVSTWVHWVVRFRLLLKEKLEFPVIFLFGSIWNAIREDPLPQTGTRAPGIGLWCNLTRRASTRYKNKKKNIRFKAVVLHKNTSEFHSCPNHVSIFSSPASHHLLFSSSSIILSWCYPVED